MVTANQMRKLALAQPGAEEKSHFEQPDFRVKNKVFVELSQDSRQGTLKLPPELQAVLLESRSDAFAPAAGAWGRSGWTRVTLANVELELLQELVREAWSIVAPKTLVAAHSGNAERKRKAPTTRTKQPRASAISANKPRARKR